MANLCAVVASLWIASGSLQLLTAVAGKPPDTPQGEQSRGPEGEQASLDGVWCHRVGGVSQLQVKGTELPEVGLGAARWDEVCHGWRTWDGASVPLPFPPPIQRLSPPSGIS